MCSGVVRPIQQTNKMTRRGTSVRVKRARCPFAKMLLSFFFFALFPAVNQSLDDFVPSFRRFKIPRSDRDFCPRNETELKRITKKNKTF